MLVCLIILPLKIFCTLDNIIIDKDSKGNLIFKQLNFRSGFINTAVKLVQAGAFDFKLPFEINHEEKLTLVSSPMKRKENKSINI